MTTRGAAQVDGGSDAGGGDGAADAYGQDDAAEGLLDAFEQELEFGEEDSAEFDRPAKARDDDEDDDPDNPEDEDEDEAADANAAGKKQGKDADDAGDDPDGDYVEHDGQKLAVRDLLEAHKFRNEVTGTVAEIRQRVEHAANREIEGSRQALQQRTTELERQFAFVQALVPKLEKPPASMLDRNSDDYDPEGYHFLMRGHTELQEAYTRAQGFLTEAQQQQQQDAAQRHQRYVADNARELLAKVPELGDPARAKAFAGEVKSYLTEMGFAEAEIAGVTDWRLFVVLKEAMAHRAAKAKGAPKPKEAGARPRLVRQGERASPAKGNRGVDRRGQKDALTRLQRTGRVRDSDLEAVFGDLID